MGRYINDRVFGSDIALPIRTTLERRQQQTMNPQFGQSVSVEDIYYDKNINADPGTNLDLASRTPWARMWTAIRGYFIDESGEKVYGKGNVRIYEVGNHIYDDYNFHNTSATSVNKSLPENFLTSNEFSKPAAGITEIVSTSQGPNGIYWETIVNFKVYNFFDYSNIFAKFFLYPGARIFVDFGWDTSNIYNQKRYFSIDGEDGDADNQFGKFTQDIFAYASLGSERDGLIATSGGSLNVIEGYVTDWNSKTLPDGSFDCSVTITSGNKALIDYEKKGGIDLNKIFAKDVTRVIIEKFLASFNLTGEDETWETEFWDLDFLFRGSSEKALDFYKIILERLRSTNSIKLGVFYDKESVDKKFNTLLNEYEFEEGESKDTYIINNEYSEIPLISQEVGVYYSFLEDSSAESIGHSNENIYVTIEFLEEELLNKNLGFKFNEDLKKEISFDSTDQLSNFSEDLLNVQLWTKSYTGLSFLYPTLDRENLKEIGKIPIRNLFVNLDLILNAFESEDTVFSAIKNILDRITSDSYGVMKLILKERSDNRLTIVDLNSPLVNVPKNEKKDESTEEGEDENATSSDDTGVDKNIVEATKTFYNFDDLFVFNPYSPNSIVSNMDLSLEMPSNTMASIIAINATSIDKQIYPGSPGVRLGMGLKDLHVQVDDNVSGSDGKSYYEWLPSPSSDTTNKINDSQLASKISSLYIPEGTIIDSDTPEYKSALSSYG